MNASEQPSVWARRFGYSIAIVVNLVLLYIFNRYIPARHFRFLTADYGKVLGLFNVSIVFAMASNVVWIFYDPKVMRSVLQVIQNLLGIAFLALVYQVFPFDFAFYSPLLPQLVRVALWLGMAGAAVGIVVELIKLFSQPKAETE